MFDNCRISSIVEEVFIYSMMYSLITLENKVWERTCDFCLRPYDMNAREIPRIYVSKKIDISDIESQDYIASPDYCDLCSKQFIRFLERKSKLRFSVNGNRIIKSVVNTIHNHST